ncbi:MAG: MarR family transcriptional regulator [Thermonemataceae bacterium]|nr:MarR family transcriptional regulator [Thermonemataceae bacterium]
MKSQNNDTIGLFFYLLDKTYHKLLSYDLEFTSLERYFYVLWAIDESEQLSQQNLADLLKVDKASVVRIIDELEKKGFVERRLNAQDKRSYVLVLGKKGIRYIKDIREGIDNLNAEMFIGFSPMEKEAFMNLLAKAYQNLSQQPETDFFINFLKQRS